MYRADAFKNDKSKSLLGQCDVVVSVGKIVEANSVPSFILSEPLFIRPARTNFKLFWMFVGILHDLRMIVYTCWNRESAWGSRTINWHTEWNGMLPPFGTRCFIFASLIIFIFPVSPPFPANGACWTGSHKHSISFERNRLLEWQTMYCTRQFAWKNAKGSYDSPLMMAHWGVYYAHQWNYPYVCLVRWKGTSI